jgi:hypothetical protein
MLVACRMLPVKNSIGVACCCWLAARSVGTFLLPLCISVDTPGCSPQPLHYIVFPLPPLFLVSFLPDHCVLSSFRTGIAKGTALRISGCVSVVSVVLCPLVSSSWKLWDLHTWLLMAVAIPPYAQITRRKYIIIAYCDRNATAVFIFLYY